MASMNSVTLDLLLHETLERKLKGLDHELGKLLEMEVTDSDGTSYDPEKIMRKRLPEIADRLLQKQITAAKASLQAAIA